MMANHGKLAPLKRMQPGDTVLAYSPKILFAGSEKLQCFTALGKVKSGSPYQVKMSAGWKPFRRDVSWRKRAREVPIKPLLQKLELTSGKTNWGFKLQFGFFQLSHKDATVIVKAMTSK